VRTITTLFVSLALLVAPAATASAGGGNNYVQVSNTTDGTEVHRSRVAVAPTSSDTVDNENLAFAKSSCDDCRTVAVAMQAVLVMSKASTVAPKNVAVAANSDCTACKTAAFAYQYVVTPGKPVRLTEDGREQIAEIGEEVAKVAASDDTFTQIDAKLDALFEEFKGVIDSEMRQAGARAGGDAKIDDDIDDN